MYRVSDDQVDYILNDIKARGVGLEDLQYNLLDHVCCIIENEMQEDQDFYKFYKSTISRFFKNELKEIEDETNNLLTFKNYYGMKRLMKITGLTSAIMMLVGSTFKILHVQGANIALVLGVAIFGLIFLPLMVVLKTRDEVATKEKALFAFGTVIGIINSFGVLFKVMHWPYANILMLGSLSAFILLYIPAYFILKIRNPENKFNTLVNTVLMIGAGGILFTLVNVRSSKAFDESLYATYNFLHENTNALTDSNAEILAMVNRKQSNQQANKIHAATSKLYTQLVDYKAFLVSKADDIPMDQARYRKVEDVRNIKDTKIVNLFSDGKFPGYSLESLEKSILEYNASLEGMNRQIAVDRLQLYNTNVGVLLHQLTQIQLQIAVTENSYLNYVHGSLAKL